MIIILSIYSISQLNAQTRLSGNGANTCSANDGGVASNTSLGCNAGNAGMTGTNNTSIGEGAGNALTWGANNTLQGFRSGYSNQQGNYNIFTGSYAGYATTSSFNTFNGGAAGYYNTTGNYNSFFGYTSGYRNTTGSQLFFLGHQAGYSNSTASYNVAIGTNALYYNQTGAYNTCIGNYAGEGASLNSFSYNTFIGYDAGCVNRTGNGNVFLGSSAGVANTTGTENVFVGKNAGFVNTGGNSNTFIGLLAGGSNTTAVSNVCLGNSAGTTITTNGQNTVLGTAADISGTNTNCIALGYGAYNNQGSNTGYIGNANYGGTYCANGLFQASDSRFKFNVKEEVKGLEFINKLRPVTYQMDTKALDLFINQDRIKVIAHTKTITDSTGSYTITLYDTIVDPNKNNDYTQSTATIHSGFLAQEVELAANSTGFNSTIVSVPSDPSKSNYALNYAEIVVPLVKAVQELSKTVDSLKTALNISGSNLRTNGSKNDQNKTETILQIELANNVLLYQNEPNPFDENTVIKYYIPENFTGNAYIIFYDIYGNELEKTSITEKGNGKINASTKNLTNGIYSYSLIIDGAVKATKKMIKE